MINWRKVPLLILAYFSIGVAYAATTRQSISEMVKKAVSMGDYLKIAQAYIGADGWNFIITFITITAVIWMGSGSITNSTNATDEMKTGMKVFAAAVGLATAYWCFANKINFAAIVAPWALVLAAVLMGVYFVNIVSGAREKGELSWIAVGAGGMVVGTALVVLLGSRTGWVGAIGWLMIIFGAIVFGIGIVLKLSEWRKEGGLFSQMGSETRKTKKQTHKARDDDKQAEKEIKKGKRDAKKVLRRGAAVRAKASQQLKKTEELKEAAKAGDLKKAIDLTNEKEKINRFEIRLTARDIKPLSDLIGRVEKAIQDITKQEKHLQEELGAGKKRGRVDDAIHSFVKGKAGALGRQTYSEIKGRTQKVQVQLSDLKTRHLEPLKAWTKNLADYDRFAKGYHLRVQNAIREAKEALEGTKKGERTDVWEKILTLERAEQEVQTYEMELSNREKEIMPQLEKIEQVLRDIEQEEEKISKYEHKWADATGPGGV